ncbi:SDR family NAD(P)-dependent oxidoreductase [Aeromicrobium sp. UC242_57]|uniref:SDR family NAD(P)-dependent oxidoreductase n=1 Tax=Aeromicrobium sp. UC242_57 TaxID=3374624 RepID=UPI003789701B
MAGIDAKLENKVAVVVGTGPAIGRACVVGLAQAGARVICLDVDRDAAEASAGSARELGVEAEGHQVDVLDRSAVRSVVSKIVEAHGAIDVLVNVVGTSKWSLAGETSDEEWDLVFDLNLRQQWVVVQEVLPHIPSTGGSIVAIASMSGLSASTRHGAYGAAKAGLISLVKTLAVEYGPKGIRVNAVAPGTIDTPARSSDTALAAKVPLGRRGCPEDIGLAATFLASGAADYITGQVLVVDGGVTVKHTLMDLDE